jgi:cation:H+ antiporter
VSDNHDSEPMTGSSLILNGLWLLGAILAPLVWLIPHFQGHGHDMAPLVASTLTGIGIVGAAFMLSWATELAERDVPPALALIVLALIAVLPEYAVDMTFAWKAGQLGGEWLHYPMANMTGANRVLIGIGWSMLALVGWWKSRAEVMVVDEGQRLPLGILLVATLFSFAIQVTGFLTLWHTAAFVLIFAMYVVLSLKSKGEEHGPVGPAKMIDDRVGGVGRWIFITFFLVYSCAAIFLCAEPFAHGLVETGKSYGIDEFILVQLVAPLASESPEFVVAFLFVLRGRATTGLGALVSSLVNQWTLLVGLIPVFFGAAFVADSHPYADASRWSIPLFDPNNPVDNRQGQELLLTSAMSLFAITVLSNLRFAVGEALVLFGLFLAQWVVQWLWPEQAALCRYGFTAIYLVGAAWLGLGSRAKLRNMALLLKMGR